MFKEILSEIIHVIIFFIQFAFVIAFFCFIFTGFVNYFDPESELAALAFSITWKSGLIGLLLLILAFSLTVLSDYLTRKYENTQ